MRLLWTVNLIPTDMALEMNMKPEVLGGWVEAMSSQLKGVKDIELAIACKCEPGTDFCRTVNGVAYYSLAYSPKTSADELAHRCGEIISSFRPDIIHIEGTEFLHAGAMLTAAKKAGIPAVASMQGILNGQYSYQCGQLQVDDMLLSGSLTEMFAAAILHLRKRKWYKPRMKTERKIIEGASYVLGRTTWDRAHTYAINPKAKYFSCNRVLRQPFYGESWDKEKMQRHSIYVGNGYFALKGLHFVVQALPELIREYPDVKVYVAGYEPYKKNDSRAFFKKGYAAYLKKLITDLGVQDHIEFTGPLKAQEVAEKLATVNAYVLCSAIENSPNTLGEAMLVGTPCVAAYVGGVPDMADDGKEALFYRNDDPQLLAWNIKRIFDSDELALRLSENGRKRARVTHDPKLNADTLLSAYQTILSENTKEKQI
ncbi:MAG: glycosyltransferase [Clostridia bacterium]|nr:glycosyltransferase [Clostridia bacterium]